MDPEDPSYTPVGETSSEDESYDDDVDDPVDHIPKSIKDVIRLIENYVNTICDTLGSFSPEGAYQNALVQHLELEEASKKLVKRVETEILLPIKYTVCGVTRVISNLRMDIVVHTLDGHRLILELKHLIGQTSKGSKTLAEVYASPICQLMGYQRKYQCRYGAIINFPRPKKFTRPPVDRKSLEEMQRSKVAKPLVFPFHISTDELRGGLISDLGDMLGDMKIKVMPCKK
eukprot:gnl/Dysnectes_brevis/1265_a1417_2397.p1 GENE.gnl/Dysnectes_brevis/1265_a1417_2397~~gnl/Dysnectes_brevis/1265_a1417_2397.p1  ORF type:complete len:230 (-),score=38.21 gnl/Dysnectes_brevis/1265_a1417_2397:1205-1894(-)